MNWQDENRLRALPQEGVDAAAEARKFMTCMGYTQKWTQCTRRYRYGRYQQVRVVYCAVHARLAGWSPW